MATTGLRRVIRTAKTADSSQTGVDMMAELEVRLRSRKDSISELGLEPKRKPRPPETITKWRSKSDAPANSIPLKKREGTKGKSKSEKLPSVSESEIVSRTKWHVKPTENEESEIFAYDNPSTDTRVSPPAATKISYSAGSRLNTIPPPPKTPPPVLANKIHQGGEPTPKSMKSTAAETVVQSTTTASPRGSNQPKAKMESSERKSAPKKDTSKSPEGKSKNGSGVKELARLFGGRNGSKGNDKERKMDGGVTKTTTKKPKDDDVVRSVQISNGMVSESVRMTVSSGRTPENQKRDDSTAAVVVKDRESKRPVNETSSLCVREHEASLKSKNPYQNVFDDPAFARFDKRLQSVSQAPPPPQEEGGGSLKKEKKPKPLPRKGSLGSQALRSMASDDRNAPQSNSQTTEATQPIAAGPAITISAVDVECMEVDKVAETMTTSQQPEIETEAVVQNTQDMTVLTEARDELGDLPSHPSSDTSRNSQAKVFKPLEELESEIDLLAGIAQLPPLREVFVPHKAELTKTMSHNPGGGPITRRTTPKERKELRHGVRSDGAQLDSDDDDDYIRMRPGHMHQVSASEPIPIPKDLGSIPVYPNHKHQLSAPEPATLQLPSNPRSSTYYLKILPPMPSFDPPSLNELVPPKSPGNDYVDMETKPVPVKDMESKSLPIHLLHENETRSSAKSETKPSFSSLGKGTKVQISRFKPVNYSQVTIKQTEAGIKYESTPKLKTPSDGPSKDGSTLKYPKVEIGKKNEFLEPDKVLPLSGDPKPQAAASDLKQTDIPSFAHEVVQPFLPPVPKENVYYMTHKGGKMAPLSSSAPGGRVIWHEYVEIDEEELEKEGAKIRSESIPNKESKKLAESPQEFLRGTPEIAPEPQRRLATKYPPEVPKRPDYLEKLAESPQEFLRGAPEIAPEPQRRLATKYPPEVPKRPDYLEKLAESPQEFLRVAPEIAPEPQRRLATNCPPEVPKRPDYLEKLAERTSAEYSYAAIPGQNLFGLQWMNFHARIPQERTPQRAAEIQPKKATPPRYIEDSRLGRDRPPTPPPKSDSLLREQGLIPAYVHTPSPYLIPIPKRKGSTPDLTLYDKKATPPPSSTTPPRSPKDVIAVMRKELLSIHEKDRNERESSPRRNRRTPPPRPAYPPKISPRKATSTSLLSLSDEHVPAKRRAEERHFRNGRKKLARQRSQSTGEISPRRAPLRQSKSYAPESKPAASDHDHNPATSDPTHIPASEDAIQTVGEHTQLAVDTESHLHRTEDDVPRASPQVKRRHKKGAVQGKIDRKSLALIMQNREAIVRQLSLANDQDTTGKSNNQQESASTPGSTKKALVRGLGEILLELDTLLQNEVCTEEDLITAIEQHLHIQIRPQTQPGGGSRKSSRDESQKSSGGVVPLPNPAIEITDGDVEDVVSFVNENRVDSLDSFQEEVNPSRYLSPPPDVVIKPRSATVIVKPDSPEDNSPESERKWLSQSETTPDHYNLSRGNCQAQPLALSLADSDLESPTLESPGSDSGRLLGMRDSRSRSAGHKQLKRVNAKRRPSNIAEGLLSIHGSTSFCNGSGVFTHLGGKLTNVISGVEIEIPEGAVPKGKKQKVWFDVLQMVYNYSEDEMLQRSSSGVSDSDAGASQQEIESHLLEKRDRQVQLSPIVLVGPYDAVFQKPIKIKIPHCLPYRNNAWHLRMLARAQNSKSEDWFDLPNSSGIIIPPSNKKRKFFKETTYQMHLEYAVVKTRQLGCFQLCGNPIRNGCHSAKKMVASVYARRDLERTVDECLSLQVVMTNSIFDEIQVLDKFLASTGYDCLERNVPILCFGDGKDLELTLSCDSNTTMPLATKTISFGQFWRMKKVGQPHASFAIDCGQLDASRTVTLRIQQAGARIIHETNFVIP